MAVACRSGRCENDGVAELRRGRTTLKWATKSFKICPNVRNNAAAVRCVEVSASPRKKFSSELLSEIKLTRIC